MKDLERKVRELEQRIGSHSIEDRFKDIENRIQAKFDERRAHFPSVIAEIQEDVGFYEAMFDLLVLKKVATQEEISGYLDTYKHRWTAVAELLISKKIFTVKELNCAILAYHHFLRMPELVTPMNKTEYFKARIDYIKELSAMPDPLEMLGH